MELRQLRYFVKIVDLGSVSKASKVLYIAQPALSQQMAQLEAELGLKLLTRLPTGVRPTEYGEVFYAHAQRILREIADVPGALAAIDGRPSGRVTVGLPQSTAAQYALPLIADIGARYPGIQLEFFDEISGHILKWIVSGRFDLGVLVSDEDAAMLDATPLMDEYLYLVSRPDNVPCDVVHPDKLCSLPIAIPAAGQGVRPMVDAFLAQRGLTLPEPKVLANSMNLMRLMVLQGDVYAISPWGAVADELAAGLLVTTPIEPPLKRRAYVCTARGSGISLAAAKVKQALFDTVRQRVEAGQWQGVDLL